MCGGEGTAMCGEPRVAAECTCTERDFGRCSRPTVRPGRTANDERDHGDGSSTRSRGQRTSGSLTETRVCDWQYLPERFDGSADRTMNPCSLDGTDQRARTVLAACIEPDRPVDADGDQALVIDDARHPAFLRSGRPGSLLTLAPHRSGRAGSAASGSSTDSFATRRRVPAGPGSQAMATAIPKAYLASSAIRCRDVETGPNLGVLAVFPSTGATCRCPLPSTGSRGLNSPASAVL